MSADAYALDGELAPVLAALAERDRDQPAVARGDWRALRRTATENMRRLAELEREDLPDVQSRDFVAIATDGAEVTLRWYAKRGEASGAAVVFAHGGGLIAGSLGMYDPMVGRYVDRTGVPFLSVDYRLAPGATGTVPADDAFAALRWLIEHASELAVDPARIAVMGESAGGTLAAGMAIRARDHGLSLARQILIYPMLDDRNVMPGGVPEGLLTWDHDASFTCWTALLGADRGTEAVPALAAPARLTDFQGLAPAYVEVGDLDVFRDEDLAYAQRLAGAGVPVELHVHPGAPHGYERYAPTSALAGRALADRTRVLQSL